MAGADIAVPLSHRDGYLARYRAQDNRRRSCPGDAHYRLDVGRHSVALLIPGAHGTAPGRLAFR